jgi:predicted small metal-binding protein
MGKELRCGDRVPGCGKVIHGKDESEVMSQASAHATNDHKLTVTPELAEKVRKAVRDS